MNPTANQELPDVPLLPDLPQQLQLSDALAPAATSFWAENAFWLLPLALLAVVVMVGLIVYFITRKRRKVPSPEDRIREEIARIRSGKPAPTDRELAFALSLALRHYIETRYGIRAPEQTTEEFLVAARTNPRLNRLTEAHLEGFLARCDQTKFGRSPLTAEERDGLFRLAESFVTDSQKGFEEEESAQFEAEEAAQFTPRYVSAATAKSSVPPPLPETKPTEQSR